MAIPETQLKTWSNPGAQATAKATHETIRRALTPTALNLSPEAYSVYLQGSYANDTNVRGDSDVDIVAELTRTFGHNISQLAAEQQRLFHATYTNATYYLSDFRTAVLNSLRTAFGNGAVTEGDKCVKVARDGNRLAS